ncbi:hypothetical protein GHT06_010245 [Daphnia sinensis]|uniref:Uncharacterized protein n=1 Tax=Daphnia sinensis TaxID=1820382 RepID=A0AAD5LIR9_9CRUS|nr:hypothetical protein GHT06_010245 [Daphnia sinensis]
MPLNSFPAPKALPGTKKEFPQVFSRVNSGKVKTPKFHPSFHDQNSSEIATCSVGQQSSPSRAYKCHTPKPGTHHDSSGVSACLNKQIRNPLIRVKSVDKTPRSSQPDSRPIKPTWNITTQIDAKKMPIEIPSLPGRRKTLKDLLCKPFQAKPLPPSTYEPFVPVTRKRPSVLRNKKLAIELSPAEEQELREFELAEKVIPKIESRKKEKIPDRFEKATQFPSEGEVTRQEAALVKMLEEIIFREIAKKKTTP